MCPSQSAVIRIWKATAVMVPFARYHSRSHHRYCIPDHLPRKTRAAREARNNEKTASLTCVASSKKTRPQPLPQSTAAITTRSTLPFRVLECLPYLATTTTAASSPPLHLPSLLRFGAPCVPPGGRSCSFPTYPSPSRLPVSPQSMNLPLEPRNAGNKRKKRYRRVGGQGGEGERRDGEDGKQEKDLIEWLREGNTTLRLNFFI